MSEPFDAYAKQYDETLNRGLEITGETKRYFAEHRVRWTAARALTARGSLTSVLDFGCGTGESSAILAENVPVARIVGVDSSEASLAIARRDHQSDRVSFRSLAELPRLTSFDLVYVNGVFHHIPPSQRHGALANIAGVMAAGGVLALWENNPFNPGTRWVMRRLPFDKDAVLLRPAETRRVLKGGGLDVIETTYHFFFPRALAMLRPAERALRRVPAGGQYVVLARRP